MEHTVEAKPKKPRNKKPDLTSRAGKYFIAKASGLNKTQSAIVAGYPDGTHTHRIENSKTYQEIEKTYFKDEILKQLNLEEIAGELRKNIVQDTDRGAKNKAIEIALSKIEPDKIVSQDDDRVMVILKA